MGGSMVNIWFTLWGRLLTNTNCSCSHWKINAILHCHICNLRINKNVEIVSIMHPSRSYHGVIKWKHFPNYWLFVRGIHRWPVNSPKKRPVMWSLDVFCNLSLKKRLSKQSRRWWFETLSRHYDITVTPYKRYTRPKCSKQCAAWHMGSYNLVNMGSSNGLVLMAT